MDYERINQKSICNYGSRLVPSCFGVPNRTVWLLMNTTDEMVDLLETLSYFLNEDGITTTGLAAELIKIRPLLDRVRLSSKVERMELLLNDCHDAATRVGNWALVEQINDLFTSKEL